MIGSAVPIVVVAWHRGNAYTWKAIETTHQVDKVQLPAKAQSPTSSPHSQQIIMLAQPQYVCALLAAC